MRYTNNHNLPGPLARAIMRNTYGPIEGQISVTGLIQPPQKAYLEDRHASEIVVDVADEIWALFGASVHAVLERARTDNALQEERLSIEVDGWKVTGKPDLYEEDATLSDWKVTSVYSFLLGDKPDWEAQLNAYAELYRSAGFAVNKLQIVAILKDWKRNRRHDSDYPPVPAMCVDIPVWPHERIWRYLQERVSLHKQSRMLGEYPDCTPEERWMRPDIWAVKKLGNTTSLRNFTKQTDAEIYAHDYEQNEPPKYALKKPGVDRALKVLPTFVEADCYMRSYQATKGIKLEMEKRPGVKTEIEFRPGESVRCAEFCNAAPWCQQWSQIQAERAPKNQEAA